MEDGKEQEMDMDSKNYTQVLIDGKIYTLGGMEDEGYLQKTASYVNEKNTAMRRLPGFTKQSADYQMAMVELNMADDYFKAVERADEMERQRDAMEKDTYSLKHELVSTQIKLETVLKELEENQKQLEQLIRTNARLEASLKAARRQAAEAEAGREQAARQAAAAGFAGEGAAAELREAQETVSEPETDLLEETAEPVMEAESGQEAASLQAEEAPLEAPAPSLSQQAVLEEQKGSLRQTAVTDEELAKRALQAAKKAGSHRGGRR